MAIPDYQTVMLPLLKLVARQNQIALREARLIIADEFKLTDQEKTQLLPSGKQSVIYNRVGWACTYLHKAGLIDIPQRGILTITARGKEVLAESPRSINVKFLERFPEFVQFREVIKVPNEPKPNATTDNQEDTPEERLEDAHAQLRSQVLAEIVERIKALSPHFFENLVVETVVKMGYGGSLKDAGKAIGKSGDEGIDGIINEDRLGLDVIYLQAKRWEGNVSRPEIQKFAGALQGKRARKGIFITTSDFTAEARDFAKHIDAKIVLISGQQLAELMWEHNIGLSTSATYEVKKLDLDYFSE